MKQAGNRRASQPLEPGLLAVFQLILWVTIALQTIMLGFALDLFGDAEVNHASNWLFASSVIEWGAVLLLLWYLYSETLARLTGRWYLPLAVVLYTGGAVVQQFHFIFLVLPTPWLRSEIIASRETLHLMDGGWGLVVALLPPLVMVAWQYNFKWVLLYLAAITLFELPFVWSLTTDAPQLARASDPPLIAFLLVIRPIIFGTVGYIITRMIGAQRQQRQELAAANEKLRQHATTLEQLTISRERNQMARELHDTLAHSLSAVAVQLEAADSMVESSSDEVHLMLTKALAQTRSGLAETRRAMQSLRASPLDDLGFKLALQALAEITAQRGGLHLELNLAQIPELPSVTEQHLYRIAQEALINVLKHANASRLLVCLQRIEGKIRLVVHDNGIGFDPTTARRNGHFGLAGIEERAAMIDGTVTVHSQPASGTTVELIL